MKRQQSSKILCFFFFLIMSALFRVVSIKIIVILILEKMAHKSGKIIFYTEFVCVIIFAKNEKIY